MIYCSFSTNLYRYYNKKLLDLSVKIKIYLKNFKKHKNKNILGNKIML